MDVSHHKSEIKTQGFTTIANVFSPDEISALTAEIEKADTTADTFRKSANLFAIRQFLNEVPQVTPLVFNQKIRYIINTLFGSDYFAVKSIYFDKPGASNWFVAYHQDLTISVTEKHNTPGYGPWTVKQGQFAVQPPLEVLANIYTIRIHLDDTDENNGALKVIPGSHAKGIYRPETIDWSIETENSCTVPAGGIMIMKPLLLHSSARTVNNNRRRVIHIEFSNEQLPEPLHWAEADGL
jgi:ectoine hydroxylase-related dioxygenase (phytanoyl-CoA dioxygenase family)